MNKYMEIAYKEAKKAFKKGEVPIGAVIVKNDKIIAKAHNKKEKYRDPTKHAEILVIQKACKKLKTWHLDGCEIYITLEPCLMCCGGILHSRIKNIYYGVESKKFGYVESIDKLFNSKNTHKVHNVENMHCSECSEILNKFFKNKR